MIRIDAHQHFWETARGDYGWLTPDKGVLWRDYGPADLAPLIEAGGIDKTILVQAAPTEAETRYLLEIAHRTPFVAGVVGWVDFEVQDVAERIAELAADPLLVGLRPMVQDIADDGWLAKPGLATAFEALIAHDLIFDALVLPRHLRPLLTVLERHPALSVVVDHAAKPHIAAQSFDPWREDMRAVAAHANTVCKLSGLVTEASATWMPEHLRPVADCLLDLFGPSRLLFGSDWPVVTLRAGYARWLEVAESLLSKLSVAERESVFGGNAARIYLGTRGRR